VLHHLNNYIPIAVVNWLVTWLLGQLGMTV
jgi:hypothetical protein